MASRVVPDAGSTTRAITVPARIGTSSVPGVPVVPVRTRSLCATSGRLVSRVP